MPRKPKNKQTLLKVVIECSDCGVNEIAAEDVTFYGHADECEMCGSHGQVGLDYTCKCGKGRIITFREW